MAFQSIVLFFSQLKHKIAWESVIVPFDLAIHLSDFYLIHIGKVPIQYNLNTPDCEYMSVNITLIKLPYI